MFQSGTAIQDEQDRGGEKKEKRKDLINFKVVGSLHEVIHTGAQFGLLVSRISDCNALVE